MVELRDLFELRDETKQLMMQFAFGQLQDEVGEWSRRNFPNNEPVDPLLGVGEEVGELNHAFLKRKQGIRGSAEQHQAAMVDAVGDIAIYLADFCERNCIDLADAILITWAKVKQRNWQANPTTGVAE